MRLFVALDIDDATRATIGDLVDRLRRALSAASVKWVPPANLHVSLQFIGHVPEDRGATIQHALARPVAVAPFDMCLHGLGVFPDRGGPRVIWCGASDAAASLAAVQRDIERRLVAIGAIVPESRPFRAHLTLGRYRETGSTADRRRLEGLGVGDLGRTHVDRVTLYESRLSPKGPTYVAIAHTPLSATIETPSTAST